MLEDASCVSTNRGAFRDILAPAQYLYSQDGKGEKFLPYAICDWPTVSILLVHCSMLYVGYSG